MQDYESLKELHWLDLKLARVDVDAYFQLLEQVLTDNDLMGKANCIFNMDESDLQLNNRPGYVLAEKGSKAVSNFYRERRNHYQKEQINLDNETVIGGYTDIGQRQIKLIHFQKGEITITFRDNLNRDGAINLLRNIFRGLIQVGHFP
ncbi:hypothetical protein QE152_g4856 [Popillia japonica]|uniref:Transposase n=1 Tax=Popillia japonica TaxID=7064 RepID=A0AAW1MSK2_POPJA